MILMHLIFGVVLFVGVVLLVVRSATLLVAPYLVVGYTGTNDIDVLLTLSFFALP